MLVEFSPEAAGDLAALDRTIAQRVLTKIRWLAENHRTTKPSRLHGDLANFCKLRIGDWRVLYELDLKSDRLIVRMIGHRRKIYTTKR